MVEGSQIDWECHSNKANRAIRQTLLFDQAVQVAVDFAVKDGHTLVLSTNQTHATNIYLMKEPGYDPLQDFVAIAGLADLMPRARVRIDVLDVEGSRRSFEATLRLDGPIEVETYRQGGIMPAVLRRIARSG